jgi:hypothetical protein
LPTYEVYAGWVKRVLAGDDGQLTPGQWLRDHRSGWRDLIHVMADKGSAYEAASLVISRWEFLGGLYRGNIGGTGCEDAVVFADRFLQPTKLYHDAHNLINRQNQDPKQSDIFMMLRNKPLHGFAPAGIEAVDPNKGVVAWMLGAGVAPGNHLSVDADTNLHVNTKQFADDLYDAMGRFADYLDLNINDPASDKRVIGHHLPRERWLRAHWARYMPHTKRSKDELPATLIAWMMRGAKDHGIPI